MSIILDQRLLRGRRHLASNRLKLALFDADWATSEMPDCGLAWELKGLAHFEQGEYEVACDAFERASLSIPIGNSTAVRLAETYGYLGRTELAEDLLLVLADRNTKFDPEAMSRIAAALDRMNRSVLAADVCRVNIACSPDCAEAYVQLARYGTKCGMAANIVDSLLRHSIFLEPKNAYFRVELCYWLVGRNQIADAVREIALLKNADLDSLRINLLLKEMRDAFSNRGCGCLTRLVDKLLAVPASDSLTNIQEAIS